MKENIKSIITLVCAIAMLVLTIICLKVAFDQIDNEINEEIGQNIVINEVKMAKKKVKKSKKVKK